jgi:hypothetical protein
VKIAKLHFIVHFWLIFLDGQRTNTFLTAAPKQQEEVEAVEVCCIIL